MAGPDAGLEHTQAAGIDVGDLDPQPGVVGGELQQHTVRLPATPAAQVWQTAWSTLIRTVRPISCCWVILSRWNSASRWLTNRSSA